MARRCICTLLALVAAALLAPAAAQARTPCPDETTVPTSANTAQVSESIFCLTNAIRAHFGLPPLRRDWRLDAAARLHSVDMALNDFFAHVNLDGLSPQDRADAQGYRTGVGENIAYGYRDARSVVLGWMASEGHCRNMLSAAVDIGVGTGFAVQPYYTQDFGDYFSHTVDQQPRNDCPHRDGIDVLTAPPPGAPGSGAIAGLPGAGDAPTAAAAALALTKLSLSRRVLRRGTRSVRVSYRLSVDAHVTFRLQRVRGGRYVSLKRSFRADGVAGANAVRLPLRALRPGRYRVRAFATGAAGDRSSAQQARFLIARRP